MLTLLTADTRKGPSYQMIRYVDLPTSRNSYKHLLLYMQSILKPVNEDVDTTQGVEVGDESSSHVFQAHIPCSFHIR